MEEVDYFEGWLTKKTRFKSRKYWCSLSEGFLYYWKDKAEQITRVKSIGAGHCKEKLDLSTAHQVRKSLSANSPPFSIDIVTKKDDRFTLIACNKRECDLWVKYMQTAMHDRVRRESRIRSSSFTGSLNSPTYSSSSQLDDTVTMDTTKVEDNKRCTDDVFEQSSVDVQHCSSSNHDNTRCTGRDLITTSDIPQQLESVTETQQDTFTVTNCGTAKTLPVATVRPFSPNKLTTCANSSISTKVADTIDDNLVTKQSKKCDSLQNDDEESHSGEEAAAEINEPETLSSSRDDVEEESTVTVKMRNQNYLDTDRNCLTNDELTRIVSKVWDADTDNQYVMDAISVAERKYSLVQEKVKNHSFEVRVPEAQQLSDLLTTLTVDGNVNSDDNSDACHKFDSNYMQLLLEALGFPNDENENDEIF